MGRPIDRSNRFLVGEPGPFDKAFPTLQDVLIEYCEVGKGESVRYVLGRDDPSGYHYGPPCSFRSLGGLIRCGNPVCSRGGYEIDFDVHDMVRRKLVEKEFTRRCQGDEGSPKGQRLGRRCLNYLRYKITVQYKPEHEPLRLKLRDELSEVIIPGCPICRCPLIQEHDRAAGLLFCGLHEFRNSDQGELTLESSKDYSQWPRKGEKVHAGQLRVQCLEVDAETAKVLVEGGGDDAIRARAAACAREAEIPVLSKAEGGFNEVIFANGQFRVLPLTGHRARRFI